MGFLQSQNLTVGFSQPEVTHWESTSQIPSAASTVNNTIIVLGVLTFGLQLCLVLFFMLRCWRLDKQVGEALKHPGTADKPIASSTFHPDIYKQASYQLFKDAAASSPAVFAAVEEYEPFTNSQFLASIPWDLVQR